MQLTEHLVQNPSKNVKNFVKVSMIVIFSSMTLGYMKRNVGLKPAKELYYHPLRVQFLGQNSVMAMMPLCLQVLEITMKFQILITMNQMTNIANREQAMKNPIIKVRNVVFYCIKLFLLYGISHII